MPDLIRHPVFIWIPAFAGMTILGYLTAEVILRIELLLREQIVIVTIIKAGLVLPEVVFLNVVLC
jgi:hypothetical protein